MRMRYRLQVKESIVRWDRTGEPVPVSTYRWTDIYMSNDREALKGLIPADADRGQYRIEDTMAAVEE